MRRVGVDTDGRGKGHFEELVVEVVREAGNAGTATPSIAGVHYHGKRPVVSIDEVLRHAVANLKCSGDAPLAVREERIAVGQRVHVRPVQIHDHARIGVSQVIDRMGRRVQTGDHVGLAVRTEFLVKSRVGILGGHHVIADRILGMAAVDAGPEILSHPQPMFRVQWTARLILNGLVDEILHLGRRVDRGTAHIDLGHQVDLPATRPVGKLAPNAVTIEVPRPVQAREVEVGRHRVVHIAPGACIGPPVRDHPNVAA